MSDERSRHWDDAYAERGAGAVSWYQAEPRLSLELIDALGVGRDAAVLDVGGGASLLVDELVERGFIDLAVLDLSKVALTKAQRRLGGSARVKWLHEDVLNWHPERRYDLWHDRAVFHFLVSELERDAYLQTLRSTLTRDGSVVLGTFAVDGPEICSGLPVDRYSAADLVQLLGPTFQMLEARREEHTTPGGTIQPFTWVAGRMTPA